METKTRVTNERIAVNTRTCIPALSDCERARSMGANAQVFKGTFNGMQVAVKEVRMQRQGDAMTRLHVRRLTSRSTQLGQHAIQYEAKLLSSLAHPNIVHLFGTSFQNGKCYMVMELCHHSVRVALAIRRGCLSSFSCNCRHVRVGGGVVKRRASHLAPQATVLANSTAGDHASACFVIVLL